MASSVDSYVEDLLRVSGQPVTDPVCPLCLRSRAGKDMIRGHIFPRRLDGRRTTLTCKHCDETLGHELEGPVINYVLNYEKLKGRRIGRTHGIRTWIVQEGKDILVHVNCIEIGRTTLTAVRSERQDEVDRYSAGSAVPHVFHTEPRKASDDQVNPLLARIGYLAAFEEFRYGYILQPAMKSIRAYIQTRPWRPQVPSVFHCSANGELYHAFPPEDGYTIRPVNFRGIGVPMVASRLGFVLLPPLDTRIELDYSLLEPGFRVTLFTGEETEVGNLHVDIVRPGSQPGRVEASKG